MGRLRNFLSGNRVDASAPPPHFLHIRSSKLFILATICVAVFTDIFLYGVVVPVIPFALYSRAGVHEKDTQSWVSVLLAVYGAALLLSSPVVGWYADRSSSRRLPLLIGLFALAGATVMLCLARTVVLLVLGRILQGITGAIVWTVGQALLVDTVGEKEIGQMMGYVGLSMSLGVLVAPLVGGAIYNKAGYYAVYYVAFALIGIDIVLRLALIEKKIARQWSTDEVTQPKGASSPDQASDGSPSDTTDEKSRPDRPPISTSTPDPVLTPPPRRRSKYPPIFTLLRSRRLLTALWGCTVQGSLMTAFDSTVPLFVQRVFGWNSLGAGLVFLALIVPSFAGPLVGWMSDKHGPRWLTVTGFMIAIPFWILLRLVTHNTMGQKILFCALLALIGLSLTLVMPPLMAEITYVVEAKERQDPGRFGVGGAYAQAYGLFVTAFAAGTLIGPIWAGYVEDAAGWGTMSWSLGLFSFAGAMPCLIWTGGLITRVNAKSGDERAVGRAALSATRGDGVENAV